MFAEKLGRLMQNMLRGRTKYITVAVSPGEAQKPALPPDNLPKHVAIIMDGNGRWAVQHGLPRPDTPRAPRPFAKSSARATIGESGI